MARSIETVIFDFGGVLYNLPSQKSLKRWSALLNLGLRKRNNNFLLELSYSELFWDVMRGKSKEEDLWESVFPTNKIPKLIRQKFLDTMSSPKNLNIVLVNYFSNLKGLFKLGILSNAGDNARKTMESKFGFNQFVNQIIISAEEGFVKPEREIFEIALKRLESKPDSCLFVDDLKKNVEAAQELGMKTIYHSTNSLTLTLLDQFLFADR